MTRPDNIKLLRRRFVSAVVFLLSSSALILISLLMTEATFASHTSARTPTRTLRPTRTPTRTPTPMTADFSLTNARKNNPGDVLDEIYFGGVGGGGSVVCTRSSDARPYLAFNSGNSGIELMRSIHVTACGWDKGERVQVFVRYPNGRTTRELARVVKDSEARGDHYLASYYFIPDWQDTPGTYNITFSGSSGMVSVPFRVYRPKDTRVIWFGNGELLLHEFAPREKVRLFVYDKPIDSSDGMGLSGWQEYQVDSQGNLMIWLPKDPKFYMIVVGVRSGESSRAYLSTYPVSLGVRRLEPGKSYVLRSSCPGAPAQRLRIGITAEVCTKRDRVIIREGASRSSREIVRLEPGTSFRVVDGPSCANNWSWWKINWGGSNTGWVAEGGDRVDPYFICPVFDISGAFGDN